MKQKTPMQELLEWIRTTLPMDLETPRMIEQKIESMLEKEKEVMESAWQDGMYECDGDGTFEDFYKTFNTNDVK